MAVAQPSPEPTSSASLTWEQKLGVLQDLAPANLRMRAPGAWQLRFDFLQLHVAGELRELRVQGRSIEETVEAAWYVCTSLRSDESIAITTLGRRSYYRWTGWAFAQVALDRWQR